MYEYLYRYLIIQMVLPYRYLRTTLPVQLTWYWAVEICALHLAPGPYAPPRANTAAQA